MTQPKRLTYLTDELMGFAEIQQLPAIRATWGDDVGQIAELWADEQAEMRAGPTAESKRYSLQRILNDPHSVRRDEIGWRLDTELEPIIGAVARKTFGLDLVEHLSAEQLRECARLVLEALQAEPVRRGRPAKRSAASWVRLLLDATSGRLTLRQQKEMLEDVLGKTCGAVGERHIERLIREARALKVLTAGE